MRRRFLLLVGSFIALFWRPHGRETPDEYFTQMEEWLHGPDAQLRQDDSVRVSAQERTIVVRTVKQTFVVVVVVGYIAIAIAYIMDFMDFSWISCLDVRHCQRVTQQLGFTL